MPRAAATSVENNFSKGLITEATAMNYPENSVIETDNCIYSKNGKVIRRYGIDYETDYVINAYSTMGIVSTAPTPSLLYQDLAIQEYEWNSVSNDGNDSFIVVQVGNIITFYKTSVTNNISSRLKSYTLDLTDYQVPVFATDYGQYVGAIPASFSSGFGYLFVAHQYCNPIYVSYNATLDTITATAITITVRDFERLDDTYAIDFRPTSSLTDLHKYNLYNQGWYVSAKNAAGTTINVVTYWDNTNADWPSNADIWYIFKNTSEALDTALFSTKALGNTPAPNGHYTYNAFDIDRDAAIGTTGLPAVTSGDYRPSVVAFFSGRVFYAGVQASNYNSKIYFSKIIEGAGDFGTCYQLSDPTSEIINELLPSDGGVINIPDIGTVLRLVPVGNGLLVFASNGVWKISGPDGVFSADDYSVTKISNTGITAPNSVVVAEGLPFWWNTSGIYSMSFDAGSGKEQVSNITETTIQSVINDIPDDNLAFVKGIYNDIDKNIHWLYKSEIGSSIFDSYSYDKLLVLNLTSQSFSISTISDSAPKVCGLVFSSFSSRDPLINVSGASLVKYLTAGAIGTSGAQAMTVSQFNDSDYYDWTIYDGVGIDAESYFISGYRVRGELLRKYQSNYISIIMAQEENASVLFQGIWDYANSTASGRYTSTQQAFREDTTVDYSRAKLKVRGNGYSLQFKFTSEPGKPFTIVGWTTSDTGVSVP